MSCRPGASASTAGRSVRLRSQFTMPATRSVSGDHRTLPSQRLPCTRPAVTGGVGELGPQLVLQPLQAGGVRGEAQGRSGERLGRSDRQVEQLREVVRRPAPRSSSPGTARPSARRRPRPPFRRRWRSRAASTPAHRVSSVQSRPPVPMRSARGTTAASSGDADLVHQVQRRDLTVQCRDAVLTGRHLEQRLVAAPDRRARRPPGSRPCPRAHRSPPSLRRRARRLRAPPRPRPSASRRGRAGTGPRRHRVPSSKPGPRPAHGDVRQPDRPQLTEQQHRGEQRLGGEPRDAHARDADHVREHDREHQHTGRQCAGGDDHRREPALHAGDAQVRGGDDVRDRREREQLQQDASRARSSPAGGCAATAAR